MQLLVHTITAVEAHLNARTDFSIVAGNLRSRTESFRFQNRIERCQNFGSVWNCLSRKAKNVAFDYNIAVCAQQLSELFQRKFRCCGNIERTIIERTDCVTSQETKLAFCGLCSIL